MSLKKMKRSVTDVIQSPQFSSVDEMMYRCIAHFDRWPVGYNTTTDFDSCYVDALQLTTSIEMI